MELLDAFGASATRTRSAPASTTSTRPRVPAADEMSALLRARRAPRSRPRAAVGQPRLRPEDPDVGGGGARARAPGRRGAPAARRHADASRRAAEGRRHRRPAHPRPAAPARRVASRDAAPGESLGERRGPFALPRLLPLVMATGIVSNAFYYQGQRGLSAFLLAVNLVAFPLLVSASVGAGCLHPSPLWADLSTPATCSRSSRSSRGQTSSACSSRCAASTTSPPRCGWSRSWSGSC